MFDLNLFREEGNSEYMRLRELFSRELLVFETVGVIKQGKLGVLVEVIHS